MSDAELAESDLGWLEDAKAGLGYDLAVAKARADHLAEVGSAGETKYARQKVAYMAFQCGRLRRAVRGRRLQLPVPPAAEGQVPELAVGLVRAIAACGRDALPTSVAETAKHLGRLVLQPAEFISLYAPRPDGPGPGGDA